MARDRKEAIDSYITDMLALEDHIEKALKSQLTDLKDHTDVVTELRQVHRKVEHHISDLRALAERREAGGLKDAVKRAGSAVAGVAAGVIDLLRTEGLPKNLRDDYTAFSLATIGYVMLYTTAASLDEREVVELAHQHLNDYTQAVVRLNAIVPAAVLRYLREDGLPVREAVLPEVDRVVREAWQTGAPGTARSGEPAAARRL